MAPKHASAEALGWIQKHPLSLKWSPQDKSWVATAPALPSLSWLDEDPAKATTELINLLLQVLTDMRHNNERWPA